ncbi:MAG TPA: ATP-binding protein [Methylomirabilota bacterium]|nr:ATP-binding protein [Methylomirabilota bacterium]
MNWSLVTVELQREQDVVLARQRARQIASLLKFVQQDQVRIATAVSEIARNAYMYGRKGRVEFSITQQGGGACVIRVTDSGPGIANLTEILDGLYVSRTGMGLGIVGARRLLDGFEIKSAKGAGVEVTMRQALPIDAPRVGAETARFIAAELAKLRVADSFSELQEQNHELVATLEELQRKQNELATLNHELEDTNRGVVALYAELDEKADHLRRASEIKTRFLSNMTHEFRTPVNSILSLCRLLLDRVDGDLTPDQEKQVKFIQKAATDLSEFVNDLLDLAKVEAGKVVIRPARFEAESVFGALRGMLRPLIAANPNVNLVFEDPVGLPEFNTDESKLSQILRNFISNALKYTDAGEVRVRAQLASSWDAPPETVVISGPEAGVPKRADWVVFSVADSGLGIARKNIPIIFEEFSQIEGSHQKTKGTGLGLPLSKRLAELLGGGVAVVSSVGVGSTFYVFVPTSFSGSLEALYVTPDRRPEVEFLPPRSGRPSLLLVDDDEVSRYVLRGLLADFPYSIMECADPVEGLRLAKTENLAAIFLDLIMPEMDGFQFLQQVKADPKSAGIPIVVHSSKRLSETDRQLMHGRVAGVLSKDHRDREASVRAIRQALANAGLPIS